MFFGIWFCRNKNDLENLTTFANVVALRHIIAMLSYRNLNILWTLVNNHKQRLRKPKLKMIIFLAWVSS